MREAVQPRKTGSGLRSLVRPLSYAAPVGLLVFLFLYSGLNFQFLVGPTNWSISTAPIDFSPGDPYWRAFLVGLLNTIIAGVVAIVFATFLGFLLSMLRLSGIKSLEFLARLYSDVIRNIPVILQAMFWYAVLLNLPNARNAVHFGGAFVTNRGMYLPWPNAPLAALAVLIGFLLLVSAAIGLRKARYHAKARQRRIAWSIMLVPAIILLGWGSVATDWSAAVSWPEPRGLNIREGMRLPIEFSALVLALVFYRAAYISEIFRAGFRAVPTGQIEAARSLSLNGWDTLTKIRIPLTLVTIIPPMTSEFVLMIKITSIGILVGFAELYSISANAATLSNRALEATLILTTGYLVINFAIVTVMHWINRRVTRRGER